MGDSEHHAESLYHPQLYTTLPRTDSSRIDLSLRDDRGMPLDLQGTGLD